MTSAPIHLTILRRGDTHIVDLAEVGSLIPRSETQVDNAFLHDLTTEMSRLTAPGHGRRGGLEAGGAFPAPKPEVALADLRRVGGLIFSHLLTEPARKRLRTADPCDLYLRLDEHLIHVPWELCHDGESFLATKFRVGRQVITGAPIPGVEAEHTVKGPLKVLLVADPTESLPEAGYEADSICTLLDGVPNVEVSLLGGKHVRKLPLLAALQDHDVVHFAGHSYYDAEHPSHSGWRLHEGVLTAGELSKLHQPPLLVFSNSCQAGATAEWENSYRYEGQAFGIGSAFLLAGVRNYIGTFWVVHDDESVLFAREFYQNVVAGLSLGEALLSARHAVLRQRGWHGLTWASYMLYGDPASTLLPATDSDTHVPAASQTPHTATAESRSLLDHTARDFHAKPPTIPAWSLLSRSRRRLLVLSGVAAGVLLPVYLFWHQDSFFPESGETPPRTGSVSAGNEYAAPVAEKNAALSPPLEKRQLRAVGVMHFKALSLEPQFEWMREAIRDSLNSQLSGASDIKVYSKEYIDFLVQKSSGTEIEVANQLGIAKMISGSFLALASKLRIEAHVVDVQSGVLEASDHVEGEQGDFFTLHRQLAEKIMARLNITTPGPPQTINAPGTPPAPSLDTYKLLLEAEGETPSANPARDQAPASPRGSLWPPAERLASFLKRWPRVGDSWTTEALAQANSNEVEIQQLLERYRQAYEKKDLALLDSVYDTLSPTQREANAKYFQQTKELRVTVRDVDIAISGDEAAVNYTREDLFVDAKTGQNAKLTVRFTKFLVRTDNVWKIASGKKEQWAPVKE